MSYRFDFYNGATLLIKNVTVIAIIIIAIMPSGGIYLSGQNVSSFPVAAPAYAEEPSFNFIVPIMNIDNPQYDIDLLKPYITGNDTVIFPMDNYLNVTSLQNHIPGLELGTGGTNITSLLNAMPTLPSNIHYITYDYERGWSPEWTADFNKSMEYFGQLHDAANQAGRERPSLSRFLLLG